MLTAEDRRAIEEIVETVVARAIGPLLARLQDDDDEYIGPETQASLDEEWAKIQAGEPTLTTAEVLKELGIEP
jgi:hypothetical protein